MLSQALYAGFRVGEISCPAKYFPEASSINFRRSVVYGLGVLGTSASFRLARMGFDRGTLFEGLGPGNEADKGHSENSGSSS